MVDVEERMQPRLARYRARIRPEAEGGGSARPRFLERVDALHGIALATTEGSFLHFRFDRFNPVVKFSFSLEKVNRSEDRRVDFSFRFEEDLEEVGPRLAIIGEPQA